MYVRTPPRASYAGSEWFFYRTCRERWILGCYWQDLNKTVHDILYVVVGCPYYYSVRRYCFLCGNSSVAVHTVLTSVATVGGADPILLHKLLRKRPPRSSTLHVVLLFKCQTHCLFDRSHVPTGSWLIAVCSTIAMYYHAAKLPNEAIQ